MAGRRTLAAIIACWPLLAGCSAFENSITHSTLLGSRADQKHYKDAKLAPLGRISPKTHLAAGRLLEGQGNFEGAIGQYEKAIASNPRLVAAYNRLGILYQKLGQPLEAERIFKQGIRADPGAALLHNNLGYAHLSQGRTADAEKEFREALMVSPEFRRARMNLAIALGQRGRLKESLVEFSRVVPADIAHFNVAVICLNRRDYAAAEGALRQALEINPNCPGAREHLAKVMSLSEADSRQHAAATQTPVIPLAGSADAEGTDAP